MPHTIWPRQSSATFCLFIMIFQLLYVSDWLFRKGEVGYPPNEILQRVIYYTNNALTPGCHGRMTNPRGDCPLEAQPVVDNHLEVQNDSK